MGEATEKILGFLKNLKFKKKIFGGVDEQEVLKKFSDLDGLYQAAFIENMGASKEKISTITDQLQIKQQEVDELTTEISELKSKLENSSDCKTTEDKVRDLEIQLSDLSKRYDEVIAEKLSLENESKMLRAQLLNDQIEVLPSHSETEYELLQDQLNELTLVNTDMKKRLDEYEMNTNSAYTVESMATTMLQFKKQQMAETLAEKEKILEKARQDAEKIISAAELDKEQIRIKTYLDIQQINKQKEQLSEELNRILKEIQAIFSENSTDYTMKTRTLNITEADFEKECREVIKRDELFGNAK